MSVFCCEKCKRKFANQEELEKHWRIYFYSDGMDASAKHDLASLEQTVSYLLYSRALIEKSKEEIYKEYSILERKYHDLLDDKSKRLTTVPTEQKLLCNLSGEK